MNSSTDSFHLEQLRRGRGWAEQELGEPVNQDPVDLLGHAPVETPQARLDVRHRHVQLGRGESCGQGRVGIPVDESPVGADLLDRLLELHEHVRGLPGVRSGTDPEVALGHRKAELLEEDIRHPRIVVLPGVNEALLDSDLRQGPTHRSRLDELGASPPPPSELSSLLR